MKFEPWIPIADYLSKDTEMVGTAMPLTTNEAEVNKTIREFFDTNGHHLKKLLVESKNEKRMG